MNDILSDVYAAFAKLTKIDKAFSATYQTKRLREAISMIVAYGNDYLFTSHYQFLHAKGLSIYFKEQEILKLELDMLCVRSFDDFSKNTDLVLRRIVRGITNLEIDSCVASDSELVDVHRELHEIYRKESVKITGKVTQIRREIMGHNANPILVYGDSSSGKTISVAQAIDQILLAGQASVTWIDLSDVNIEAEHFFFSIARAEKRETHIIVVDNVQAYPSKLIWLIKAVSFLREVYPGICFKVVNISWRSARKTIIDYYKPQALTRISCAGDDTIIELIRSYALDKYEKEILSNSSGDVLIAKNTIEFILSNAAFPNEKQLAYELYKKTSGNSNLSDKAIEVLYHIASLGEFEIHVRAEYLKAISEEGFKELCRNDIIRNYKTEDNIVFVAIGHRSLAHKILVHLRTIVPNPPSPIDLAIEYLTIDGESQILSTLERLDLELETNDSMMAKLWQAFCNMRDSVFKQIAVDPTWGNNMASMIFAAEALNNLNFGCEAEDSLRKTRDEIYRRWRPASDYSGIEFTGEDSGITETSEIVDFTANISQTMRIDEEKHLYEPEMQADSIDFHRFHDNWLLGLLLGFEGNLKIEGMYKDAYIKCAMQMQQANGSFYPARVCWVTARVIMGLCECGLSYSSSVVKHACNWLVDQLHERESMHWSVRSLNCSGWRSGTGSWNSDEQITLMCICALFKAQYPIRKNSRVYTIVLAFWKCRKALEELFIQKATILDIVWIIDVMLLDNRNPIELQKEIKDLTDYVLKQWGNASLLSSEKETESSDVSFMAKELLSIVWALLNKNIGLLLKGLELDYSLSSSQKDIFISYRREEGGGSAFAQSLYPKLNTVFRGNVFLDVYDLEHESDEFDDIIETAVINSKVLVAIVSDHCFDRACVEGYPNESDVFFKELDTALAQGKSIVTVYNSSSKKPECPDALKANPDFYRVACSLSKKNALFYDATAPNALSKLSEEVIDKIKHINI